MVMSNGSLFTGRSCVSKVEYRRQKINRQGRGSILWAIGGELGDVDLVVKQEFRVCVQRVFSAKGAESGQSPPSLSFGG
jgi:hypothetical protein